jgi:phosphatidate cytidylyltransferase
MTARQQCLTVLVSIVAVLSIASVISFVLWLRVPRGDRSHTVENLIARIKAWWVMVILMGGAVLAGRCVVIALFGLLSLAALREFITLTPTRRHDYGVLFLSFFVVLPIHYGLIWANWYGLFVTLIPVYTFLILPIASVVLSGARNFLARASETQWGLMICVFCISHVPALFTLEIPGYAGRTALLVVFLLVIAQSSDVLQYIFGKLLGRHKIAPEISPTKTVEGFFGGVLAASALGLVLWYLTPFTRWQAAGMALVITITGFLGGLVMSAIKRDRGVKDWGRSIAGHGGVLDRLDSVAFSAPVFFHLTRYFFAS